MNNYFGLLLFIPLYFVASAFLFMVYITDIDQKELESYRLREVMNYCSDAAVEEMLVTDDLNTDYATLGDVDINPETALDTFSELFCMNYGLRASKENKLMVRTRFFKVFTVCGYDGYYKAQVTRINPEGDRDLIFTPKLPYSYEADGGVYGFNLGIGTCYFYKDDILNKINNPFSRSTTSYLISSRVSDDIMYTLDQQYSNGALASVYIPAAMSNIRGTNTILGPTVMVLADGVDLVTRHAVQSFNVGATAIVQAKSVIAYYKNGTPYYCYDDKLKAALGLSDDDLVVWVDTYGADVFTSTDDAAKQGYYYDNDYMN